MNSLAKIIIAFLQPLIIFSQIIPKDDFSFQISKLLYDAGKEWHSLTNFGPVGLEGYKEKGKKKEKNIEPLNYINWRAGLDVQGNSFSLHNYTNLTYKNYYSFFNPRIIIGQEKVERPNKGTQLINPWSEQAGIGFKNIWATLQIGKGRESWGAGDGIQLALSEESEPYDYFLLASDYGNIRVRYIHGFLERVQTNINRYITARGFEWTNKKSIIIGFSETVIYSGENRSFEIGYLNPISSHLEIELNKRMNYNQGNDANAVWQFHLEYLINKSFRLSINYLFDEFVLDPNIEIGKEHGKAFSHRLSYTIPLPNDYQFTFYSSFVHVGTPTFRHVSGINNFVQNNRPLGWYRGSDAQELCIGVNYFNYKNFIFNIFSGILHQGNETITRRVFEPYSDYIRGAFPSGEVVKNYFSGTSIIYNLKENYIISATFNQFKGSGVFEIKINVPIYHYYNG